ncbi:hypothetical protein [Brevibacillus sp. NRS-1366]|uniref:hypothetical protein n=1 Tax=Brevibacillus sp. NRS-1366 TaxID=3233899 RepID=UPI003D2140D3
METHVTIGVIVPLVAKPLFENVLQEFDSIRFKVLLYKPEDQISDLIKENLPYLDVLVFGGAISYWKNKGLIPEHKPMVYIDYSHAEVMKGLLKWEEGASQGYSRLGLDTFRQETVDEIFAELDTPLNQVYVKEFQPDEPAEAIISYFQELWREQKIDHVVTCRLSVYRVLQEEQIPCTYVLPTKFNIRQGILRASLLGENSKNLESQVAVGIFSIDDYHKIPTRTEFDTNYEMEKLRLDFHREVLDFSRNNNASVVALSASEMLMYANRGAVEETVRTWVKVPILQDLKDRLSIQISVGFGVGPTTLAAQNNAKRALERARERGGDCGFLVREDGKVVGPLGRGEAMQYVHKTDNPIIQQLSEETGLSVETVSKLLKFSQQQARFSAEDLAHSLSVTPRTARNLLKRLKEMNYLQEMGEEKPYAKGRPRQTYRITLNEVTAEY